MTWFQLDEIRRRQEVTRQQAETVLRTSTETESLVTYRTQVRALLDEVGQDWGGVNVDRPRWRAARRWWEELFLAPPITTFFPRVYQITETDRTLSLHLGQGRVRQDRIALTRSVGEEAGGFRVTLLYRGMGRVHLRLNSTHPHLPEYQGVFSSVAALRAAIRSEWGRGTFVRPFVRAGVDWRTYPPPQEPART